MKRGEIWTVAGGGDSSSKARPAVIVQDDRFEPIESVTVCLFTSEEVGGFVGRIRVEASVENGLDHPSYLMVDKLTTLGKSRLGRLVGHLNDSEMRRLRAAALVFLGFADGGSNLTAEKPASD